MKAIMPKIWTSQPPTGTAIDENHPLAKGLIFLQVGANKADITGNSQLAANIGTVSQINGRAGAARMYNSSSDFYQGNVESDTSKTLSVFALLEVTAWGDSAILSHTSNFSDAQGVAFFQGASALFVGNDFRPTNVSQAETAGAGLITLSSSVGVNYASTYLNGVQRSENTSATAGPNLGAGEIKIASSRDVVNQTSKFYFVALWNRLLTRAEHAQLNKNPWQIFKPRESFSFVETSAGAQNLTPSLYSNAQTFYPPSVTRGAVTLTPNLFSNANAFYTATLTRFNQLILALFTNNNAFYSATITTGAVSLTPALFTNNNAFYSATISNGAAILQPSLYSNSNTVYNATASYSNALTPNVYTNPNTFYIASISALNSVTPSLFSNGQTFYAANVSTASVTLTPNLFTNNNSFYSHVVQIQGGPQLLAPNVLTNVNTFYSFTLGTTYTATAGLVSNVSVIYAPLVSKSNQVVAPLLINSPVFYNAAIIADQVLLAGLFTNSNLYYSAFVQAGDDVVLSYGKRLSRRNVSKTIRNVNIQTRTRK